MSLSIEDLDFKKGGGLIPVVVQDEKSKDVLMVAYANREALEKTIKTGYAHYWSRSRREIWKKGETSGHFQKVRYVRIDCDNDTILYVVNQEGVACHLGKWSCFHNELTGIEK